MSRGTLALALFFCACSVATPTRDEALASSQEPRFDCGEVVADLSLRCADGDPAGTLVADARRIIVPSAEGAASRMALPCPIAAEELAGELTATVRASCERERAGRGSLVQRLLLEGGVERMCARSGQRSEGTVRATWRGGLMLPDPAAIYSVTLHTMSSTDDPCLLAFDGRTYKLRGKWATRPFDVAGGRTVDLSIDCRDADGGLRGHLARSTCGEDANPNYGPTQRYFRFERQYLRITVSTLGNDGGAP